MHDLHDHPANRFGSGAKHLAPTAPVSNGRSSRQPHDRRLLLVLALVEESTKRQLLLVDIARTVNLSPGRLAHLFKSEMGVSPQRYVNNIRLEKAKECLENGVLSVKEIAAEVGISNVSRFCRCFKARYGSTPKEYRKTHLRLDLKSVVPLAPL